MMINNEIERKEIYDLMSENEQWVVDNQLNANFTFEEWSHELYSIQCNYDHEWEYRYHYSEGGVLQLFNQCTECGKKRDKGGSLKHSTIDNFKQKIIRGEINKFDVDLFNKYNPSYQSYFNYTNIANYEKYKEDFIQREIDKKEREKRYDEYLQSDKWKAIRLKVLKRDNNLCQACLEAPAQDVHHITYNNFGDELMFELLSVCRDCHFNRIHKNKQ